MSRLSVGHGRSEGVRGYVDSVDDYVIDVLKHCDDVRAGHHGLPFFIVGHSMGGMITIKAAMTRPEYFTGVVLMGPLIKANSEEATTPKIFMAKLVARVLPYLAVAKLKLDHVTRDEEMKIRMRKDPLRKDFEIISWISNTVHLLSLYVPPKIHIGNIRLEVLKLFINIRQEIGNIKLPTKYVCNGSFHAPLLLFLGSWRYQELPKIEVIN
ncbi:hypothetical protein SK128_006711 [Halocaridina rubra]|uniref:Serine aminopeptidase S33 domain-containing protein n=1 Tax=Halocaridina rubra TaxID=373956 RepID=A0AAN8XHD7_HALRR